MIDLHTPKCARPHQRRPKHVASAKIDSTITIGKIMCGPFAFGRTPCLFASGVHLVSLRHATEFSPPSRRAASHVQFFRMAMSWLPWNKKEVSAPAATASFRSSKSSATPKTLHRRASFSDPFAAVDSDETLRKYPEFAKKLNELYPGAVRRSIPSINASSLKLVLLLVLNTDAADFRISNATDAT